MPGFKDNFATFLDWISSFFLCKNDFMSGLVLEGDFSVLWFLVFFSSFLIFSSLPFCLLALSSATSGISVCSVSSFCLSFFNNSLGSTIVGVNLVGGGGDGFVLGGGGLGLSGRTLGGGVCLILGGGSAGWLG